MPPTLLSARGPHRGDEGGSAGVGAVTEKRQLIFPELEATGWKRLEFSGETLKNPGQLKNISLTGFFFF